MITKLRTGEIVEVAHFRAGKTGWQLATVEDANDHYATFKCPDGTRPSYGYKDEGLAWRRPAGLQICPTCNGSGSVSSTEPEEGT